MILQVAGDLLRRVEPVQEPWLVGTREWLRLREGQPAEAAELWVKVATLPPPTAPILARVRKVDYLGAVIGFRSALALARIGRRDDARRAYADGKQRLGPFPTAEEPRDLGEAYAHWYLAEAHRREAEEALKEIALPGGAAPSKQE